MFVVDTCVLVDIADDDPEFGLSSATCLAGHLTTGLTISPVTYVELAPAFDSSPRLLDEFLEGVGIAVVADFNADDRRNAFVAWASHVSKRHARQVPKRPIADVLIGALGLRFSGLITRNVADFARLFPKLIVVDASPA